MCFFECKIRSHPQNPWSEDFYYLFTERYEILIIDRSYTSTVLKKKKFISLSDEGKACFDQLNPTGSGVTRQNEKNLIQTHTDPETS